MQIEKSFTQRQAELSATKQALLAQRLRQLRQPAALPASSDRIGPRPSAQILPLSFAQQRLWFLQQLEPESPAYNEAVATRFSGPLNRSAFTLSVREFLRRHEIMRCRFPLVEGRVQQVLDQEIHQHFVMPCEDLRSLPAHQREAEVQRRALAELRRPFDLAHELPWRTFLWQLAEQEFLSLTVLHHLITDGWSLAIFYREIGQLYAAFSEQQPSPLPEPTLHYADYAHWQHAWLQSEQAASQLRYWQERLHAPLPVLHLPLDHPRPAAPSSRGTRAAVRLDASLTAALRSLGQQSGCTLFMVLLTGLFLLLHRYSQQDDLLIGTPVAGRTRPELEELFGCFVNTLALRADLSGNPSVLDLLQRVRAVTLGAYDHQDVPFEKLVELVQPERSLNRHPFFSVLFVLQNTPISQASFRDLLMTPVELDNATAKFDLELSLSETSEGVEGTLIYSTDLFEAASMERLVEHYRQLLRAMSADPSRHIDELPLLAAAERQRVLVDWNATAVAQDATCLHELIEAQVERTPHERAVIFEGTALTYRELNELANQLAHHLRGLGVGADTLVGVCQERSCELIISLLAILKAGGAYVPLDTRYPGERLAFLLKDAGVSVLLTRRELQARLPSIEGVRVICLDNAWPDIARESMENPRVALAPANLAYMIYTSGSTGRPKGVLNTHEAICNRLRWAQATYVLTREDRVLQKTPYSFDVSVWEFFWPLLSGAPLVLAKPEGQRDSRYLIDLIVEQKITLMHFVPSMLALFLEEPDVERCTSLRGVICSGEALTPELQERFFARLSAKLYNLYGPTEAAVDVTHWTCRRTEQRQSVPIGYPIANTQMYVLDRFLQPVPPGVSGELYIGGLGLARGYHRRPDLTAERFLPHPFSGEPGARLYKTGDLARYLPDGAIEYIGRNDFQVKIRGNRVELGEIEAVMRAYESVQECAVCARPDASGNLRLVAYLVVVASQQLESNRAYEYLRERLPDYMIPSAFVLLDALPLTLNGKLDRKALPEPGAEAEIAISEYVAPRNPLEEQLATIWAEVLALPRVGIHDNFFAIGGHSLLITQIVARVRDARQITLPVRALFEYATIAELAVGMARFQEQKSESNRQALSAVSREQYRQKRVMLAAGS